MVVFDEKTRLLSLSELGDNLEGLSRREVMRRYPSLKHVPSTSDARMNELQGEIAPTVFLLVAVDASDNPVRGVLYFYTGKTTH